MTPIERAARAMRDEIIRQSPGCEAHIADWPKYVPEVRAVLLAIREPSEAMVAATVQHVGDPSPEAWAIGEKVCVGLSGPNMEGEVACAEVVRDWQAMIDAALSE